MIKVDRLTKKYGNFTAVEKVSFELNPGEIVGFLGPNGAGKTTVMRMLTTYMLPTEGNITVGGIDAVKNPYEVRKILGYLPESNILYPQMRVDEYLSFVGRARGLEGEKLKERVMWCVENLKLQDVLKKRNMECSKGYKQRISISAALIHDPKYLVMDEPTIGLDPLQVFMVRDFLKLISKDKVVLFSSHILQEVAAITQRVIIIHQGKNIADVRFENKENRTETLEKIFAEAVRKAVEGRTAAIA